MLLETCFARFRALREAHPEFPRVLPAGPDELVRPLPLGIRERAAALLPDDDRRRQLVKTIRAYARSIAYLEACLAPGAMRWSDDGAEPVEPVTEEQQAIAAERLARQRREFEAKAQRAAAEQAKAAAAKEAAAKAAPAAAQGEATRAKAAAGKPAPAKAGPSKGAAAGASKPAARPPVVVEIRKPRRPAGAGRRPAPR